MPMEDVLRLGSSRACQARLVVSMLIMSEDARSERPKWRRWGGLHELPYRLAGLTQAAFVPGPSHGLTDACR